MSTLDKIFTTACLLLVLGNELGCNEHEAPTPVAASADPAEAAPDTARVVSVKGTATEIVYALGRGDSDTAALTLVVLPDDRIVGVDITSVHPPATKDVPKVGFPSKLAAEGILSLRPSLVLHDEEAGPKAVLTQLESAGIRLFEVPTGDDVATAKRRIVALGELFDAEKKAEELVGAIEADLAEARKVVSAAARRPKVLFVYARGNKVLQVAGKNTAAQAMLDLVGAENAFAEVEGFRPMTAEAVAAAAPEILLMLERGAASVGGQEAVWSLPGLAQTPAGKDRRLVVMEDTKLLNFGPRLGEAALELARALHQDAP